MPDRSPPPGDAPEPPSSGREPSSTSAGPTPEREPSPTDSLLAASHSMVAPRVSDLQATGFHKPLPPAGRLYRIWQMLGLLLGRRLATVIRDDHVYLILMAAVVGVTAGGASGLLLLWIESANDLFIGRFGGVLRWTIIIAFPVLGGLAAGGLRLLAVRLLRTRLVVGPMGVIEAVAKHGGRLDGMGAVINGVGTGVSIGSGGSCGHEGPSVAIGAAVGAVLSRFLGLRLRRHVAMVGAGCAGGLAAAFNAPLAGVIFTVELVFGGSIGGNVGTMSVFIPLIVAAVAGTVTSHAIFGPRTEFELPVHGSASLADFGFYLLLAIAAGVIGAGMARAIIYAEGRFVVLRMPGWLKPALGALGVGLMAAAISSELLGPGRATVSTALQGQLGWQLAAMLLGLKIVVTALTVGSGGFGGPFMPVLYVGACLGSIIAALAHLVLGDAAQGAGAYALVGMGATFAGLMQAPLTPIVMLFELTQDYAVILPLMLGCILALLVSRRINANGLYRMQLHSRGIVLEHEAEGEVMKRGLVRELMLTPSEVLTESAELDEIRRVCVEAGLGATFVIDGEGAVVGYIDGNQLARRMLHGEIQAGSVARDLMGKRGLTLLYDSDTLAGAMMAFARAEQEVLPVVDRERRLIGVLRRGDLIAHYSDKVLGEQQEVVQVHTSGSPDQELGLGKGIILERVVVGRRWAGRSLRDLDLRGRTGVQVLEWSRGDRLMVLDPNEPLREGDMVALAGRRDEILAARELW
ncbi:chloride channel protein [Paraliomyxa miuraensis]|uniref:chloride channel protein n=1 Tax=Paraliomyxa miuraensis TaxID=376150 RepID=UPI002252FD8D|nr:chloride channel protein [Paraliomyxa miuraensis]MCX4246193.1 chloride channel protein [Paraliomyxa miuraensis]